MALSNPSSSRNKLPIREVLLRVVASTLVAATLETSLPHDNQDQQPLQIMEISSGTGEHAACFTEGLLTLNLPRKLTYQPTEPILDMHASIADWCQRRDCFSFSGI